mmetsp:Transcript_9507/g.17017  ORF Transcript_9507/g.17017 Transcript_9507/m.17017 type:complete len:243 (-) Transcript_9507:460-1188(-)
MNLESIGLEGRRGQCWETSKGLFIQIGIDTGFNLGITTGQGPTKGSPGSISAIGTTIHFDQTRSIVGNDNFTVRRTILDSQYIQHTLCVGDESLGFFGLGVNGENRVENKLRIVGSLAFVDPDHHGLVNTITGDLINNVFLALEIFLTQDEFTNSSIDFLVYQEFVEMFLGFVKGMTQFDSVTTGTVGGFDHHGIGFLFEKFFHFFKLGSSRLTDRSHTGSLDQFLLDFLVPTVFNTGTIGT